MKKSSILQCRLRRVALCFLWLVLSENTGMALEQQRTMQQERQEAGEPQQDAPLRLEMNVVYRSALGGAFSVLKDGDALLSGDQYKIIFTPMETGFVYIFQRDSSGMLFQLFPTQSWGGETLNNFNPVQAGVTYYIPQQDKSFMLDKQTGTERIYLLVSREPNSALEQLAETHSKSQARNIVLEYSQEDAQKVADLINEVSNLRGRQRLLTVPVDQQSVVSWQEGGDQFSVLRQQMENMCNGCVYELSFEHQ